MQTRADQFFALFPQTEGRSGFRAHAQFLQDHGEKYRDVLVTIELLDAHLNLIKDMPEEIFPLIRRTRELYARLQGWMESGNRSLVYWIERRGRGVFGTKGHLRGAGVELRPGCRAGAIQRRARALRTR